jgi:hypothetical protein
VGRSRSTITAADADAAALRDALHEYNVATTGYRDGFSLSCFLRDADGRLVAGIDGFTGVDTRASTPSGSTNPCAARASGRRRGCRTIVLDTHTFRAPDFLPRPGYTQVGATIETPAGYDQQLFQEALPGTSP